MSQVDDTWRAESLGLEGDRKPTECLDSTQKSMWKEGGRGCFRQERGLCSSMKSDWTSGEILTGVVSRGDALRLTRQWGGRRENGEESTTACPEGALWLKGAHSKVSEH